MIFYRTSAPSSSSAIFTKDLHNILYVCYVGPWFLPHPRAPGNTNNTEGRRPRDHGNKRLQPSTWIQILWQQGRGGGGLARGKWVTRADAVSCSERCTATTSLCLSQTSLSRRPLDWPATTVSASACIRSGLQCVSSVDLYVHGVIGNSCWRLLTTPQPSWSMTQVMRPPVVNHRQTSQYTLKLNI